MEAEIQRAWSEHADQPDAVAARLPALAAAVHTAAEASALTRFLVHFLGEDRRDWPQAAALCAVAVGAAPREAALAPAEVDLAIARFLSDDLWGGLEAEARAAGLDSAHALAHLARARLGVATARYARTPDHAASALLDAALDLAGLLTAPSPADRAMAIATNNLASGLLDLARDAVADGLLHRAAHLSHALWRRAGTWVHEARAEYLLALTARALRQPEEARTHAGRGLTLLATHGDEPVDQAFLHLVAAAADRDLGLAEAADASLARADALAAEFQESSLQTWYKDERAKAFPPA